MNDVSLLDQEPGELAWGTELGAQCSMIALPVLVGERRRLELGLRSKQRHGQIILSLENLFILSCTLFTFFESFSLSDCAFCENTAIGRH